MRLSNLVGVMNIVVELGFKLRQPYSAAHRLNHNTRTPKQSRCDSYSVYELLQIPVFEIVHYLLAHPKITTVSSVIQTYLTCFS